MASFSTPINQLPNMNNQQQPQPPQHQPPQLQPENTDNMVDDILNEMALENNAVNNESLNYAMDPSQIPPEKMDVNFLNETPKNPNQQQQQQSNVNSMQQENTTPKNPLLAKLNLSSSMEEKLSKCVKQLKNAFLVFLIVTIVSLPQFNRLLFNKFKSMLLESGEINMKGVMLKGVIGTALFLILSFVV